MKNLSVNSDIFFKHLSINWNLSFTPRVRNRIFYLYLWWVYLHYKYIAAKFISCISVDANFGLKICRGSLVSFQHISAFVYMDICVPWFFFFHKYSKQLRISANFFFSAFTNFLITFLALRLRLYARRTGHNSCAYQNELKEISRHV